MGNRKHNLRTCNWMREPIGGATTWVLWATLAIIPRPLYDLGSYVPPVGRVAVLVLWTDWHQLKPVEGWVFFSCWTEPCPSYSLLPRWQY